MSVAKAAGRRLKGRVTAVKRTGETIITDGETWQKCIFTLEVTGFSKRTLLEVVPNDLRGKKIKLVRYCLYDWHYTLGIEKTLSPDETECFLHGKPSSTVFW